MEPHGQVLFFYRLLLTRVLFCLRCGFLLEDRNISNGSECMTNKPQNPTSPKPAQPRSERRSSRRCKMKQLMRIRPSDPERDNFEDLRGTQSVSRTGVYFQTSEHGYEIGMRVFVTLPYLQNPASPNREYLAEVVRKDSLANGLTGVGLKLLWQMSDPHTYTFDGAPPTK